MKKNILIVEDEFIVANALRLTLLQAGYKVTGIAPSSEAAEEHIEKLKPDLVLLDIRLNGELSGIDLAKKLSAANIAFIYLSANSSQKILLEAKKTEPFGFLVKPFREKDLLVALDIAWYRQKNSLESRLLQETVLQKQLLDISNETAEDKVKLLKIARAVRSFIPFDLIVAGARPLPTGQYTDSGYLRTGFDDYQFIGENELMTIAGLNRNTLSVIIENSSTAAPDGIYDSGTMNALVSPLQKLWLECFKIESYLVFHVTTGRGLDYYYTFYSRQRDIYMQKHLTIMNLFRPCMTSVTEKMIVSESISIPETSYVAGKDELEITGRQEFAGIIGKHPLLLAALDLTIQVSPYNTSVLILGESGTGKEKVARSIHALSARKSGPFIEVNCGAIPASLIESELFGHEKGAFTGATEKRKGRFEQAEGGTIFLDEIGELPLEMQVKLLRVLQEKEINYVGSNLPKKIDVRIVAATNRILEKEVADGRFRLDLYYRLNVFPITLPPLRERKSDIAALASFFASKFCKEFNKTFKGIAASMMDDMLAYYWPGNIRELENVLERSVILYDGKSELQLKQTLTGILPEASGRAEIETMDDVKLVQQETERAYIISMLKKAEGRIRGTGGAAELMNIKPTTLESKMAKLGITRGDITYS